MNSQQAETITKAEQCAQLLVGDIQEAHKKASGAEPALEILLRDLVGDAAKIHDRLLELQKCSR